MPDLEEAFQLKSPIDLLEYQNLTLEGLEYEAAHSDPWNSTSESDGQIVDAVIMPVARHAAVIPGKYYHTGYRRRIAPPEAVFQADDKQTAYTEIINLMNYSAAVIPMTKEDKAIDVVPEGDDAYRPLNDVDKQNWEACKSFPSPPTYPTLGSNAWLRR